VREDAETYIIGRTDIKKLIVAFRKSRNSTINKHRREDMKKKFLNEEFGEN